MNTKCAKYRNLLIIDDNERIHDDFKKIFATSEGNDELDALDSEMFGTDSNASPSHKKLEYQLQFASQGKNGFEILKNSYESDILFGAAFVDMRMPPGWDGVETIENLWKVDPDLQVVICTAFSDLTWSEIVDRLGITDQLLILKKPFDEIEVIQIAASLSEKRRLLAESKAKIQELESGHLSHI